MLLALLCYNHASCKYWTWREDYPNNGSPQYCHLKDANSGLSWLEGVISGGKNCSGKSFFFWNHYSRLKYLCTFSETTTPTTTTITLTTTAACEDIKSAKYCKKAKKKGKCSKASVWMKCQSTCNKCNVEVPCEDEKSSKYCKKALKKGKCGKSSIWKKCKKTCDKC